MARDPELIAHLEWLGYIQPVGLVVSPPALVQAQAHVNRNVIPQQQQFLACLPFDASDEPIPVIRDFPKFVREVLDWQATDLVAFEQAAEAGLDVAGLEVVLPEYHETLRPTWVVPEFVPQTAAAAGPRAAGWVLLIQQAADDQDLDAPLEESDRRWHASPHARFERLLRETQVAAGLLTNGRQLRLVYAPRGETSGYLTFDVAAMTTVAGRPIFAALHMLLCADRLFNLEKSQRLPAILVESRKYQNTVSTQLAQQVMAALYELLRGFQAADDQWNGRLLKDVLATNPQHVYHGLLTVLMRTVFVLYAEDRNLLSNHPVYTNYYSIIGLFERLRADAGQYPDTMDQRYGAWAQLLTLFRMIYEGGSHADLRIPPRKGYLFDPERYPFLEGAGVGYRVSGESQEAVSGVGYRVSGESQEAVSGVGYRVSGESQEAVPGVGYRVSGQPQEQSPDTRPPIPDTRNPTPETRNPIPRVPDGVIYRVLNNLLILDGERLSYRSLDVEQIGSVYEAIMGFEVRVSTGRSIAIRPVKKHGAPATINLEELLGRKAAERAKWLKEQTDQDLSGKALEALKAATSIEELLAALESKIASDVTPNVVPAGAMIFQPSDERRRSGSHYTPRSLTEPIVRTTLEPVLKALCDRGPREGVSGFAGQVAGQSPEQTPDTRAPDPRNPAPETRPPALETLWEPTAADRKRFTAGEIAERIRLSRIAVENARLARERGFPHPSQILDLKICDPAMGSGAFLVETCRQLGDELIKSWAVHADSLSPDPRSLIPPDEDEVLYARRLVAQRCLYGVDKNDMAVDLAKLSLWLVTLAKDHPFTFLDHTLRHGDALVGLTRQQIIGFHWEPKQQKQFGEDLIQKRLDRATEARAKILNAREDVPYRDQEQRLAMADEALNVVRLTGDACVSAFFAGSKKKEREDRCNELRSHVEEWYRSGFDINKRGPIAAAVADLRGAPNPQPPIPNPQSPHPLPPFHWEIEFPEVFSRAYAGFDGFVGNPPFLGGSRISEVAGNPIYQHWLKELVLESKGQVDLSVFFLHRCFVLLTTSGAFGLLATSSIAHGDNRVAGLASLIYSGGVIYNTITKLPWPGDAAVIVTYLNVLKSPRSGMPVACEINNVRCDVINSHLKPRKELPEPVQLNANEGLAHIGTSLGGAGFVLDEHEAQALLETDRNREILLPITGGEEVNGSPSLMNVRFAINFGSRTLEEAAAWPELVEIARERVLPQRLKARDHGPGNHGKKYWWQPVLRADPLYSAIHDLKACFVMARVSACHALLRSECNRLFNEKVFVFAFETYADFAILQSRLHEHWSELFSSRLGLTTTNYSISNTFMTFPRPLISEHVRVLNEVGKSYYALRAAWMAANDEGLTKTYNRFHDPHEQSSEILYLRELHAAMDRAVLEAYGWHDLAATARCEFLLDYEEEGDGDSGLGGGDEDQTPDPTPQTRRRRRLPWRLRWPDEFRDEVLARLLELNEQRHKEEVLAGRAGVGCRVSGGGEDEQEGGDEDGEQSAESGEKKARKSGKPRKAKKKPATGQQEMEF